MTPFVELLADFSLVQHVQIPKRLIRMIQRTLEQGLEVMCNASNRFVFEDVRAVFPNGKQVGSGINARQHQIEFHE